MTSPNSGHRWLDADQQAAWRPFVAIVELLPGVLDSQLQRDSGISHFEYLTMAMLSEAPDRTLRLTQLAAVTHATLPRLSHVISRLEVRGLIQRRPCSDDKRATNATLTEDGLAKVTSTAPGHVATVLEYVIDPLDADDLEDLARITAKMLRRFEP